MIGIITAMKEEGDLIKSHYQLTLTKTFERVEFYEGEGIVLCVCGIGKIQATLATAILLATYPCDYLINIGIAGNLLGKRQQIGDVFIVDAVAPHDLYLPFEGAHLDYLRDPIELSMSTVIDKKYARGFCVTGDQFIEDDHIVSELQQDTGANVVDMEGFAIASVARAFGKDNRLIMIKAISDGADTFAKKAHMDNLDYAMHNSLVILDEIISHL